MTSPASTEAAPLEGRFRDHAANERTMLAWIRTGISLMAFGFAIARFGLFLREIVQAGPLHPRGPAVGSAWFGVILVVLGLMTNVAATVRYTKLRRAIEESRSSAPSPTFVYVLGIGSALIAIAMAGMLARTLGD
jgi:putative membrane protein